MQACTGEEFSKDDHTEDTKLILENNKDNVISSPDQYQSRNHIIKDTKESI